MVRLIRSSLVVFVFVVVSLAGAAGATAHAPRCVVPHAWHVVARDNQATIIARTVTVQNVDGPGTIGQERRWRYCLYSAGRFRTLVTNAGVPGGLTDIVRVGRVALSGSYAGYSTTDALGGGRYGVQLGVAVTNLLTGLTAHGQAVGDAFSRVVLAPPLAVWISQSSELNDWDVQAFNARTGKTTLLDSTCPGTGQCPLQAVSPFGDLLLLRCVAGCTPIGSTSAWWKRHGVWKSALVG